MLSLFFTHLLYTPAEWRWPGFSRNAWQINEGDKNNSQSWKCGFPFSVYILSDEKKKRKMFEILERKSNPVFSRISSLRMLNRKLFLSSGIMFGRSHGICVRILDFPEKWSIEICVSPPYIHCYEMHPFPNLRVFNLWNFLVVSECRYAPIPIYAFCFCKIQ